MSMKKMIPNLLTISRIFTTLLLGFLTAYTKNLTALLPTLVLLTGYVYLSDILDGRLARRWLCCSTFGAGMDIVADLLYIVSQSIILVYRSLMPIKILLLVITEFIIFVGTSHKQSKQTGRKGIWFDRLGSISAGYYYLMPMVYLILLKVQDMNFQFMIRSMTSFCCAVVTIAAIFSRFRQNKFIKKEKPPLLFAP